MLPEPAQLLQQATAVQQQRSAAAGEAAEEGGETAGSGGPHLLMHANNYLPQRGVLQRSEFLLPLDRGSLDFYRSLMQGQDQ